MKFTLKKIEKFASQDQSTLNPMSVCVVDNIGGAYLPIAIALSKHFKKVYYHSVIQSPFPRLSTAKVGSGYKQITTLESFWDHLDSFDVIVFPDIYFTDWGHALRKMGKLVWGGTHAEVLETNRKLFKDELHKAGMPIAPTQYVKGVTALKQMLSKTTDKWIKVSYFRGEMETTHHINYNHTGVLFDELEYNMGPLAEEIEFQVEDPIPSIAELGTDGWTINGEMTNGMIWGLEVKNSCYIGKTTEYKNLPMPIQNVNGQFKGVLKKYKHTGFYSTEIRVGEDGKDYYTDPCMRAGSPPSCSYMELITNWADIIIAGCKGQLVEPVFKAKYVVEVILKSSIPSTKFLPLIFPEEYKDNIKLKASFISNGKYYIIPLKYTGFEMEEFGSVVVTGDKLEVIMEQALKIADSIEAPDVRYDKNALQNGLQSLKRVEKALNLQFRAD